MEKRSDVHKALEAMERKLRELQRELTGEEPEEGAAPRPRHPAAPPPPAAAPPSSGADPNQAVALGEPARLAPPAPPGKSLLRAGPFADIESLGRFEQALRALDGVEEVVLRGFEDDRALFDVRLAARR